MKTAVQLGQMVLLVMALFLGLFFEEANGKFLFFGEEKKESEKKSDPFANYSPGIKHALTGKIRPTVQLTG